MRRAIDIPANRAAALFIDLQEEYRRDPRYCVEGFDAVLSNVSRLQATARRHGIAVIHAAYEVDAAAGKLRPFHPVMPDGSSVFSNKGDPLAALCPEAGPVGDEPVLVKAEASAFGGGLTDLLRRRETEWLIVAGVRTEACVDATVKAAIERGFRVLLVKDACGSGSHAMHQTGILNLANRLYGGAVVDSATACRLMAGETAQVWMVEGSVPLRYTFDDAALLYDML